MNNQSLHGRSSGPPFDRDRDLEERHRAMQQHEDLRRDQERERDAGDRYPPAPHQSSAGSLPIHQPVASRISGAIHSPGGLLANHNGPAPAAPHLGAPAGPMSAASFGGPLQGDPGRQMASHAAPPGAGSQQQQVFAPMAHSQPPPVTSQPAPSSASAVYGGGPSQQQQQAQQDTQRGGRQAGSIPGVTPVGPQIPGVITQGQQPILNVSFAFAVVRVVCGHGVGNCWPTRFQVTAWILCPKNRHSP